MQLTEFLHDSHVTREVAKQVLDSYKSQNGTFLVRRTQRDENILVLSLMYNGEFFNYEICVKDALANKYFFIDDGPYFKSLPNLIEHYTKYEDGLPGILTKSIHSSAISNGSSASSMSASISSRPQKQSQFSSAMSTSSSSTSSTASGPFNHIQPHMSHQHGNVDTLGHSKSDALTRANLFKSRTLLNDQSKQFI
jgi:hypothetical protein